MEVMQLEDSGADLLIRKMGEAQVVEVRLTSMTGGGTLERMIFPSAV